MTIIIIMLIFTTALFFGSVGTPIVRKLAIQSGFIAIPKADRLHKEPTALMGGVAIYGSAIIALSVITLITWLLAGNVFRMTEFAGILIGASWIATIGFWDDRRALRPALKLLAELLPVILVFLLGTQIRISLFSMEMWDQIFNFLLTAGWILLITNAINYMDNADGIAIMTSATTSAIFLLIAVLNGQQLVSILAAAILGASLGFARYNLPLPKSTIFMGDSGSLFLGFLLAILGIKIRIPSNDIQITWMVPIIVFGLPIFDLFLVSISRWRRKISFLQGGIDHTTHRLSRLGLTGLSVALTVSLINGALGLIAIFITRASLPEAYVVAISLLILAGYVLWHLEFKPSYQFRTGKKPE